MRHHLLSFMGSGSHHPVRYALGGIAAERTAFMEIALSQLLRLDPDQDAITVFITSDGDVRANWNALRAAMERQGWILGHNLMACDFTVPKTEPELRQALATIAARAFEGDPERLSLDITHGFRAFAALGIKALELELADRERAGRTVVPTHFYYGALEEVGDPQAEEVPIWDLSEMALAAEWSSALSEFERHGRADRLRELTRRRTRPVVGEAPYVQYLHDIGRALQVLADDLCFLRRDVYRASAGRVSSLLADEPKRAALQAQFPILSASLGRVQALALALGQRDLFEPAGLRSLCALLEFYERVGRFAEVYVVLIESIGALFDPLGGRELLNAGRSEAEALESLSGKLLQAELSTRKAKNASIGDSGARSDEVSREESASVGSTAAYRAVNVHRPVQVVEHEIEVMRLSSSIRNARNDFLHWAVGKQTLSAGSLSGSVRDFIRRYRERADVAARLLPTETG